MSTTNPPTANVPLTEVKIQVPTDRVATFYALVGEWLRDPDGTPARRRSNSGRRRTAGVSRYTPIGEHLASVEEDAATLTFDEIEELIDGELPASAHKHRAWWANTETHSQALVWIRKGWLVREADLEEGAVTFQRE